MSINPTGGAQLALSVFGGLVTEVAPPDLPEGVSPDNGDVVFTPGSVASRPCLKKVFATPFPAGGPFNIVPTITYAKSYVGPTGQIDNLYLDSNGILWLEDFSNSPGIKTQIGAVTPGTYAKSATAFGREYIAISDGLHGADVPLQFDGTNLDRVTQDGPGAPPEVSSVALPSVAMATIGAIVLTLRESDPANLSGGVFTGINTWTLTSLTGVNVGDALTIAGYGGASAPMNGTWTILAIFPGPGPTGSLLQLAANLPSTTVFSTAAATGTIPSGTMNRSGNVVTVNTAAAHQLKVGYQAQISSVLPTAIGGGISTIIIKNQNLPGIAVVTTNAAHGLAPGAFVIISGVVGVAVGGAIVTAKRVGGILVVVTTSAHNLSPGSVVTIVDGTFGTTVGTVLNVTSSTVYTVAQPGLADAAGAGGGTTTLNWPIPDSETPQYFEVVAAPTVNSFQIQLTYSDGAWTTGTVQFPWEGIYFVSAVPSTTIFQYQQYGPNATTNTVGTVTPNGQAAPGLHQCQVLFLTRQGYIPEPSPPVKFVANGGQYVNVSNIPIGPPNVVARILAFTGAQGAYFFYIPAPAQVLGQQVSSATQINDNTTTAVLLDFSDNTLFASLAISIPGNSPANQIVLDGALGFGFYASRLVTWGQRSRIQNLLNMGFEGGAFPASPTLPTGWTYNGATTGHTGQLAPGHFGQAWQINEDGSGGLGAKLSQSMYQDAYGAPIAQPNAAYRVRFWMSASLRSANMSIDVAISSASTGFGSTITTISTALIPATGGYITADFPTPMPATIPPDLILQIFGFNVTGSALTVLIDEISIIYVASPFLDTVLYGSYVDNPEAFDGLSGKFGASQDTRKVMDLGIIRQNLYLLTQDPTGRIHQTSDNGVTEPAGWTVNQIGANCGLLSAFALTKSQADDSSASGGEQWMAWASASGARIFDGAFPHKISEEIQPDWDRILPNAQLTTWALNDPSAGRLYFGLPNLFNVPALVYVLDYRELDTAGQIAASGPIHTSYTGKLIATDHTRKWTRWIMSTNGAALMYRLGGGLLSTVMLGGNNAYPGMAAGTGNVYTLDPTRLSDDDFGQIHPYYVTFFFPNHDQEQSLRLDGGRKLLQYLTASIAVTGSLQITFLCDTLSNQWPVSVNRIPGTSQKYDVECGGGSAQGQRIAVKFASVPTTGTDNGFNLQKVNLWMKKVTHLPVRGSV